MTGMSDDADNMEEDTERPAPPQGDKMEIVPKVVPRNRRGKIDHSDPNHKCSEHHVRVPAHCRLKRNKRKRATQESKPSALAQTL